MSADINYKSNFVSYVPADRDVIIFVYEVPFIFWRSKLNHSQNIITKCDGIITNCDSLEYFSKCDGQLLQIATAFLLQSATRFITNCDRYYKVR